MSLIRTVAGRWLGSTGGVNMYTQSRYAGYMAGVRTDAFGQVPTTSAVAGLGKDDRISLLVNSGFGWWEVAVPDLSEIIVEMAVYRLRSTRTGADPFIWFNDGSSSTEKCGIDIIPSSGEMYANLPGGASWLSNATFMKETWNHLAIRVVFHNSTGEFEVWWNGIKVLDLSGIDTIWEGANAYASRIRWGARHGDVYGLEGVRIGDCVIKDDAGSKLNAFHGGHAVHTLMPAGDTSQEDHTLSTGSDSYALLDEAPTDNDSSYIVSNTVTDETRVTFDALPAAAASPDAVTVYARNRKENGGDNDAEAVLFHSATKVNGPTHTAPTGNYEYTLDVNEDVPGGTDWTDTEVDALEGGVEIV